MFKINNLKEILFTTIASLCCFIPLIVYFYNHVGVEDSDVDLLLLLNSDNISHWLLICIVVAIPVALDATLDLVANVLFDMGVPNSSSRILLAISLLTPCIVLYDWLNSSSIPGSQIVVMFNCSLAFKEIAFAGCLLIIMENIPNSQALVNWMKNSQMCWYLMVILAANRILVSFSSLFETTPVAYLVFLYVTSILASIISCVMMYGRYVRVCTSYRDRKLIPEELSGSCYQLLLTSVICACTIVDFIFHDTLQDIYRMSYEYLETEIIIQILFSFFISYIPGRTSHIEAIYIRQLMEEKLSFIRYISHEIRTPLNTVFLGIGFLKSEMLEIEKKLASKEPIDPLSVKNMSESLIDVNESCQVALSILNDLLTVDKIESGKLVIEVEDADPHKMIKDVFSPFKVLAREKSINMEMMILDEDSTWWMRYFIRVDIHKFAQVIRNLISNALKFTPIGGKVLIVIRRVKVRDIVNMKADSPKDAKMNAVSRHSTNTSDGNGNGDNNATQNRLVKNKNSRISPVIENCNLDGTSDLDLDAVEEYVFRVEVKDSGAGISTENQKKLFGQYVQFNAGKLQKGNGSGLGLWISKGIVELHEGSIDIYSEGEGKGSTFFVEIPLFHKENDKQMSQTVNGVFLSKSKWLGMRANKSLSIHYGGKASSRGSTSSGLVSNRIGPSSKKFDRSVHVVKKERQHSIAIDSKHLRHTDPFDESSRSFINNSINTTSNNESLLQQELPTSAHHSTHVCSIESSQRSVVEDEIVQIPYEETVNNTNESISNIDTQKNTIVTVPTVMPSNTIPQRSFNIFLVDDSTMSRNMMRRLITAKGHTVFEAGDGIELLRKMEHMMISSICKEAEIRGVEETSISTFTSAEAMLATPYNGIRWNKAFFNIDIILVDDNMPEISGPMATKVLRHRGYDGLIIGLTGNTLPEDLAKFKSHGASHVYSKPLRKETLDEILGWMDRMQTQT